MAIDLDLLVPADRLRAPERYAHVAARAIRVLQARWSAGAAPRTRRVILGVFSHISCIPRTWLVVPSSLLNDRAATRNALEVRVKNTTLCIYSQNWAIEIWRET